jgi:isopenicillin-N epimerase
VTYLNHGSFGPPPKPVVESQGRWTTELMRNPMNFFVRRLDALLDEAAARVAKFVGCQPGDLIFVPNATVAMNIAAFNTPLAAGDEVLVNDHEYGAVIRIWRRRCDETGAKLVTAVLPAPLTSQSQIADSICSRITPKTRMIVVSHITSPTATIFPVEEICRRAKEAGVPVCIDGPHAIAMLPLKIGSLGCDFYCASGHKWLSGPFGSGFLYVRGARKQGLQPPILSWGRSLCGRPNTWKDEFHWFGTYQPANYLALPDAVEFIEQYGCERFRDEAHQLAAYARHRLVDELGGEPLTPEGREWYGSMTTIRLPWVASRAAGPGATNPLQAALWERFQIEIPIVEWQGRVHIRVSCHLYTSREQIDFLIDSLKALRREFSAA